MRSGRRTRTDRRECRNDRHHAHRYPTTRCSADHRFCQSDGHRDGRGGHAAVADRPLGDLGRRRRGGRRRERHVRTSHFDARLHPAGPRAVPADRPDRRGHGPRGRRGERPRALRLGGAIEDPELPGRLRLLPAAQHQGRNPGGGVPDHGAADAGPRARQRAWRHLSVHRGQARRLSVRLRAGRHARKKGARSPGTRRRSRQGQRRARSAEPDASSAGTRPRSTRAG